MTENSFNPKEIIERLKPNANKALIQLSTKRGLN